MEFPFEVGEILPGRITVIERNDSNNDLKIYSLDFVNDNLTTNETLPCSTATYSHRDLNFKKKNELEVVIDQLGLASAKAQDLHDAITNFRKLLNSNQQKIYIIRDITEPRFIIGLLKVGIKRLFISDDTGAHHEVDPLCLLDFYIHKSRRRCGFGHELFNAMLSAENISPAKLAIDRPSFKCLAFLEKHYGLKGPIVQANNFVIYSGFFQDRTITRPPIFLYSGKGTNKHIGQHSKKTKNEIEALELVQIPVSTKLRISSRTLSSAEGCLKWNGVDGDCETSQKMRNQKLSSGSPPCPNTNANKSKQNWGVHEALHSYDEKERGQSNSVQSKDDPKGNFKDAKNGCSSAVGKQSHPSSAGHVKNGQKWGVYDAMHSYAVSEELIGWNANRCSLTPVNTSSKYSQRTRDNLQSSWNILGVQLHNYPRFQKQT